MDVTIAYNVAMNDRALFRRDAGLDAEFPDAEKRWRREAPVAPHASVVLDKRLQALRDRFEREMVDAQTGTDADFDVAQERFEIVSPRYQPPTDADVQATRLNVKRVLNTIASALRQLENNESVRLQWYQDPVQVPIGIEDPAMLPEALGMSIKGRHDPAVPLLLCRDLLTRYLAGLDAERPMLTVGAKVRKRAVLEHIATILFAAKVRTKGVRAVLDSKGISVTEHALDQIASRLRRSGVSQPVRGGAPRKPRKRLTKAKRRRRQPKP